MEFSLDMREVEKLAKQIDKAGETWPKRRKEALSAITTDMRDNAKAFAPISPKKSQYEATLQDYTTTRDSSSFQPGTLTKSIMSKVVSSTKAIVYIAMNKGAGSYASKMENEAGITWRKLGVGSEAKDAGLSRGYVGGFFVKRGVQETNKTGRDVKAFDAALKRLKKDMEK